MFFTSKELLKQMRIKQYTEIINEEDGIYKKIIDNWRDRLHPAISRCRKRFVKTYEGIKFGNWETIPDYKHSNAFMGEFITNKEYYELKSKWDFLLLRALQNPQFGLPIISKKLKVEYENGEIDSIIVYKIAKNVDEYHLWCTDTAHKEILGTETTCKRGLNFKAFDGKAKRLTYNYIPPVKSLLENKSIELYNKNNEDE